MDLLFKLLGRMRNLGATDLLLSSGMQPALRVHGRLTPNDAEPLTAAQIEKMARAVLGESHLKTFQEKLELNLGCTLPNLGRFRVNVFRQRGDMAMAIRAIPAEVPDFEALGLPSVLQEVAMLKRGLVLFVGACGSGKSTTLAAMIEHRSKNDLGHIITIEDPIEYVLPHRTSMVNQREIGVDTRSYHDALMNALRQSPDVLMIGEIRDRDTMEQAIEFADTGHLCLSTLHANTANQAFDRIINLFREEERDQVLISLAHNVRAILSQRLVQTLDGTRVLAYELLVQTARTSEIIRKGEFHKLKETMEKGVTNGMLTFDQCLFNLFEQNIISADTALEYADSVGNLRLRMKLAAQDGISSYQ